MKNKIISDNIKIIREIWGLSRDEMSQILGVNLNVYTNYEYGRTPPNLFTRVYFSRALGIDVKKLETVALKKDW